MKTHIKMQNINSGEPKTKLNMNMQMRLLKMFVKHSWRHCDRKNPFSDFIGQSGMILMM